MHFFCTNKFFCRIMHIYTFFLRVYKWFWFVFLIKCQNRKRVLHDYKTYTWAGSVSYAIEDKSASRRILDWTSTRFGLNCDAIWIELRRDLDWTATRFGLNCDAFWVEREALFSRGENWSKMGEKLVEKNSAKTTNLILVRWFCGKKLVFSLGIPLTVLYCP